MRGGAPKDTAFYYREAAYIMAITSEWNNVNEASNNEIWVADGFRYIKKLTEGSYVYFPYNRLKNYEPAYYGENVEKLLRIKSKYDPDNVFSFPQGRRETIL